MTDSPVPETELPVPEFNAAAIPMDTLPLPLAQTLSILECGEIDETHGMLRWSSNYAFLLSITHEQNTAVGVYKPRRGERPLWDFPDGTLCLRERAAFVTSQQLGWQIVPPTAMREGEHGLGTVQFFIEHDPEMHYFHLDDAGLPAESVTSQLMRIAVFDAIINNADRKGGHCLLDAHGHIWGIDQGLTFNSQHKLRTVIWDFAGTRLPKSITADLELLSANIEDETSSYYQELEHLLARGEISALLNRVRLLLRNRRFPRPGGGPSYPWPAV